MNKAWSLLLILMLAAPAHAQEEAVADEAPVEVAPAEEAAGEEAIETAPADDAPAESTETVPVGDEAPEEPLESDPFPVYFGVDLVNTTLAVSNLSGFQARDYDSGIYRLRLGARLLEQVGFEFHYGFDTGGEGSGEVSTGSYYGLFAVPHANLFDTVELAFPVGYATSSVERPGVSEDLGSVAYGLNAELPLRNFGEDYPDLRFVAGWMVYYQKRDARLYGANFGLRYDFTTDGFNFSNPFAGLDLWPFGDDEVEEVPEEAAE